MSAKPQKITCGVNDLASAFGITPRQIQSLAAQGVIPKSRKDEYDVMRCTGAYIAHVRKERSRDPIQEKIEEQKLEELKGMNEDREWERHRKRGEFIPLELVEEFFNAALPGWESKIESMRNRLKTLVKETQDPKKICEYVDTSLNEILQDIAGTDPVDFIDPKNAKRDGAEADVSVQRVGGQVSKVKPRGK